MSCDVAVATMAPSAAAVAGRDGRTYHRPLMRERDHPVSACMYAAASAMNAYTRAYRIRTHTAAASFSRSCVYVPCFCCPYCCGSGVLEGFGRSLRLTEHSQLGPERPGDRCACMSNVATATGLRLVSFMVMGTIVTASAAYLAQEALRWDCRDATVVLSCLVKAGRERGRTLID